MADLIKSPELGGHGIAHFIIDLSENFPIDLADAS
jgi:hypothetical protein